MVADRLLVVALLAVSVFPAPVFSGPVLPVPAAEVAQPFTVQDLVRLERISEPAVAPDGKRIVYSLRTTDMETNKGRAALWLLDTRKRNAQPVRMTDIAANAGSAEWSADGNNLYYLSNRSGSNQVWRVAAGGDPSRHGEVPRDDAIQVTHLPLDVGSFRVAPHGDRILVSLEVFIDCPDLACTKQRLETAAHSAARGVLYDGLFVRHWDAWSDGRRLQLFAMTLDQPGLANGTPLLLSRGIDGDIPSKPFGGREDFAFSPDGREVAFSVRAQRSGEPWSTNFDIYLVAADDGRNTPDGVAAPTGNPAPPSSAEHQLAILAVRLEMAAVYMRLVRG